jgi:lipopolysaccharide export system permease protein
MKGALAVRYIFFEMLPGFLLGVLVFVSIIVMFQVLRLTDFAISHGLDLKTVAEIISFVCISMLPALFPMSLLFAVLLTYGRLSNDSEIVALKAAGLSMNVILTPTLILSFFVALISAQTSFYLAPWGNRKFEVLYTQAASEKPVVAIKPGTFSEGFFDMVVYANEVDADKGILKNVFIYDPRDPNSPLTIIAQTGQIIPDPESPNHNVLLRLTNGDIHRKSETHTKIKFDTYDLKLIDPIKVEEREKSPQSLTLTDLKNTLSKKDLPNDDRITLTTEWHKRWAIAFLCIVFGTLGVGLGTNANRRTQKASGMILCVFVIVLYWGLYVTFEGLSRSGKLPPLIAMWVPNLIFGILGFESLRRNWN